MAVGRRSALTLDELLGVESVAHSGQFRVLEERLEQIAGRESHRRIPFLPWALNIVTPGGESLDFRLFPFQREWYEDEIVWRRFVAWMKATQTGVSEYGVRWALYWPDTRGEKSLYVFPALRQLRDFADTRVTPLVRGAYLRQRVPRASIDNKMLKTVGLGSIFFRGSKNATDLDSIPADVLALDEYDDLVQAHIPRAEKRLSGPKSRGLIRRFGVPRYTDLGIHAEYEQSDKRQWLVRCRACEKELPLHFYAQDGYTHHFVDTDRREIVCANCEARIEPGWVADGRWVAEHPDRDYIGYHVSRLMLPTAPIGDIVEESKKTKPFQVQEFWNSTLGLPYDPEEGRLSKQAIAAAISAGGGYYQGPWDAGYTGTRPVVMGVDVASVRNLNVVVREMTGETTARVVFAGEVDSFDKLATMMDAWRVTCVCIDHLPDGRLAHGFASRFKGRAFVLSWGDNQGEVLKVSQEDSTVAVRRTETIGAMLDQVRRQREHLPENLPEEYVRHMRAAVLKREEDEKGRVVVFYETQADHDYLQAHCYGLVAGEVLRVVLLEGRLTEESLTPLDEMLEFRRFKDYRQDEYSPGVRSDRETWGEEVIEIERGVEGGWDDGGDLEFGG